MLFITDHQKLEYTSSPPSRKQDWQRYSPYRTLWVRVFIRAAFDYAQYKYSKDMKARRLAEDAYRWLFEPSSEFQSFESICASFDLPIELLRAWATKITKKDVKKMEQLDRKGLIAKALEQVSAGVVNGDSR